MGEKEWGCAANLVGIGPSVKVLVISKEADGSGLAQRMVLEGHHVAMYVKDPDYKMVGKGIVERVGSWRDKIKWADLVLVDMVGFGHVEAVLRRVGVPFLGASPIMDKMELDRAAGMEVFKKAGVATPESWSFDTPEQAKSFILKHDIGTGFAVKADDNIGCATSRVIKEPEQLEWAFGEYPGGARLLVQRVVEGVEVSTEGWFNGRDFVKPFNHTFEEKRLMAGGLGPNTGCMGNVVVARSSNRLTRATVERLTPLLRRINWRGPIDINCIVNERGAYALEATARLGYDAIEALMESVRLGVGEFFREIATGQMTKMEFVPHANFSICVRLAVPPYPVDTPQTEWGEPILGINENNIEHLWLCGVYVKDNLFRVAQGDGVVLKATARGESVDQARSRVYRTLDNIKLGGKFYRLDIGKRASEDIKKLEQWGWL